MLETGICFLCPAACDTATISGTHICAGHDQIALETLSLKDLDLTLRDPEMLLGKQGRAVQLAIETLCTMAAAQSATQLTDVTRGHIDGCIYHSPANLHLGGLADCAQTAQTGLAPSAMPDWLHT